VFLDVIMPKLSGPQAAIKMRKIRSDIPVVFYTGYSREELDKDLEGVNDYRLLGKPFQVPDLSALVRQLLQK